MKTCEILEKQWTGALVTVALAALMVLEFGFSSAWAAEQEAVCDSPPVSTIITNAKGEMVTENRVECIEQAKATDGVNPNTTPINLVLNDVTIVTSADLLAGGAIYAWKRGGSGNIDVSLTKGSITTTGGTAPGINVFNQGSDDITVNVRDSTLSTSGRGISSLGSSHINISISGNTTILTTGDYSAGVFGYIDGTSNLMIDLDDTTITTSGKAANGVEGWYAENIAGDGTLTIDINRGTITTEGSASSGVYGRHPQTGKLKITLTNTSVSTTGDWITDDNTDPVSYIPSFGVFGWHSGNGDVDIDMNGGSVKTAGTFSYGLYGDHHGNGKVMIDTLNGHAITTTGENGHGIVAYQRSTSATPRTIDIVVGGPVTVGSTDMQGMVLTNAQGVRVGAVSSGVPSRMATRDMGGYRLQTVTVNGPITSTAEGVYLANGGRVIIGPRGSITSSSGIAILATGTVPAVNSDPAILPKLWVDLNLGGRRVAQALGDDWIINDGGETTIAMNDTVLHGEYDDGTGTKIFGVVPDTRAANGVWDVTMRAEGVKVDRTTDPWTQTENVIADRDFSTADFTEKQVRFPPPEPEAMLIEDYSPRAALYEVLPNVLLGLQQRTPRSRPDQPAWLRVIGSTGTHEFNRSTVDAEYDLDYAGIEAGKHFTLNNGLEAWATLQYLTGTAEVDSPMKGGEIDVQGLGLSLELCSGCKSESGYIAGRFSLSRYEMDLDSDERGRLKSGVDAFAHSLHLEAGRRLQRGTIQLTPRIRLDHARVSIDRFTDTVDARVSYPDEDRTVVALGVLAETPPKATQDGLSLWGSLDLEHRPGDHQTVTNVSGERLTAQAHADHSLALGLGGSWRRGPLALEATMTTREALDGEGEDTSGSLSLGMQF